MNDADTPCPICGQWDDKKLKANCQVNWILCSNCDRPFHSSCVRINSLEFKELSQEWSLWYCPKCHNEGPHGDLHAKISQLQVQISQLERAPITDTMVVDKIIAPAIDKILPNILNRIETTVTASLDTKINACVNKIEGDLVQFKTNLDSRISELVESSVRKHIDAISNVDATSNRRLECEIDRSVAIKVGSAMDAKINKLRIDLANEFKPPPSAASGTDCSRLDAVSDKIERQARAAHLVLRNLPCEGEAGKTDLRDVIINIGAKTNFPLDAGDLRVATRFSSTKHRICPVIVKFKSSDRRDEFFQHYFKNLPKFSLAALGLGDANSRVFLNEHLTDRNMQIFNAASQIKRQPGSQIKRVSTRNGLVFVTAAGQTKGQLISCQDDLRCFTVEATNTPINNISTAHMDHSSSSPQVTPACGDDNQPIAPQPENWSDNS